MSELVDTTVLILARRDERVRNWMSQAVIRNDVALCDQVVLEYLRGARNQQEFSVYEIVLDAFPLYRIESADWDRARAVYRRLSAVTGGYQGSVPIADALIAAVAERHHVTLVHYDEDFERIAAVTDQPQRWVVPRGSA
jgi:predicted nucleic acid-binding protein